MHTKKASLTLMPVVDFVEYVIDKVDKKGKVISTFLDLSNAFDCENISTQLCILE